MPKSGLDWSVTIACFGYAFGFLTFSPVLIYQGLRYLHRLQRISAVTLKLLAGVNFLLVFFSVDYCFTYTFGFMHSFHQGTWLNYLLWFGGVIFAWCLSIWIYKVFEKALGLQVV